MRKIIPFKKDFGATSIEPHTSIIPDFIFDLGLTPYAGALYAHISSIMSESNPPVCVATDEQLAKICKMPLKKVVQAKNELLEHGLLRITKCQKDNTVVDAIEIIDLVHFYKTVPKAPSQ